MSNAPDPSLPSGVGTIFAQLLIGFGMNGKEYLGEFDNGLSFNQVSPLGTLWSTFFTIWLAVWLIVCGVQSACCLHLYHGSLFALHLYHGSLSGTLSV